MSEKQIFRVLLEKDEKSEACGFYVPFDVKEVFGGRARVPVRGSINGTPFRSTIAPMKGCYIVPVNKQLREKANVKGGEIINVEIERDTEERIIEPTEDLAKALNETPSVKEVWEKLSYTHKKEFVQSIETAKKAETRAIRVQKTIEELLAKKK
jgi:hypothetical protein